MALQTFGAIYVGSYEISLKIFEFSGKKKIREVDHIRTRMDLGRTVFTKGSIGYEQVNELCDTLGEFVRILQGYRVEEYEAYGSPVIHSASNELFILNQIYLSTGLQVKVITNSEDRFISYKSVAGRKPFEEMIQTSAAVVDVGGSGIQITLFREGQLITTQHMEIGSLRLRSLWTEGSTQKHYVMQMEEYINKRLEVYRSLYLDGSVEYIIFMNDYCQEVIKKMEKNHQETDIVKADKFIKFINKLLVKNIEEISFELNLANDKDSLILPSMLLFKSLVMNLEAGEVWVPGLNINDGIAYDYAQAHHLIKVTHDFEGDIISASVQLAKHYHSFSHHIEALSVLSVQIFDTIRKVHGLGKRERLLLRVASILHDCGKYVSLSDSSTCAYNIIMSSEIIGLSHLEREVVALTVLYNTIPLADYLELCDRIDKENYLVVAKLSAILRVANALDQSHKQKFKNIRITAKGRELVFTVEAMEDISLEQTLFGAKTSYFENVFGMKPVLKEKRVYEVKKH